MGNIRTALFTWLFARHSSGKFIVRIEDTDVARTVPGSLEAILESLRWLGMDWDEGPEVGGDYGPYLQSQRLPVYQEVAERLVKQGHAYPCFCSPERLEKMRELQTKQKRPPGYDRLCRGLSPEERSQKEKEGVKPVIRFKTPLEGQTRFQDLRRGEVVFENKTLDDFVLVKSDGYPTYNFGNVVDDHLMEISHVIRAEEFISSTPRHLMLYQSLKYEPPVFAHVPDVLGTDRSKLSKRHGAVALTDYREQGYLPEAMLNFLALLGWSLDDKTELFTRQDLIDNFSLDRVSKTAAIFNRDKLNWMNGIYVRKLTPDDFSRRVLPFLERDLPPEVKRPLSTDYLAKVLPLVQERVKVLNEVAGLTRYFFVEHLEYDPKLLIGKDMTAESTDNALSVARERLARQEAFDGETLENMLRPLAAELGLKTGQL
ncbi:MAG: glutamate--tRNA ligase, partial [Chloroflexi bacterium RBG_16_57_8]